MQVGRMCQLGSEKLLRRLELMSSFVPRGRCDFCINLLQHGAYVVRSSFCSCIFVARAHERKSAHRGIAALAPAQLFRHAGHRQENLVVPMTITTLIFPEPIHISNMILAAWKLAVLALTLALVRVRLADCTSVPQFGVGDGYQISDNPGFQPIGVDVHTISSSDTLHIIMWSDSIDVNNIYMREYLVQFTSGEAFSGQLTSVGNGYFVAKSNLGGASGGPIGHAVVKLRLEEFDGKKKLHYITYLNRIQGPLPSDPDSEVSDNFSMPPSISFQPSAALSSQPSLSPSYEPTQCIPDGHSCSTNDESEIISPCCSSEHACVVLHGLGGIARCITTEPPTKAPSSVPSVHPSLAPTFSVSPTSAPTEIASASPSSQPTQCVRGGHSCINEENKELIPCCSPMHACIMLPGLGSARCVTTEPPTSSPSSGPSLQPSKAPSASPTASASPTIPCVYCSNDPSIPMALNNRTCEDWRLTTRKCSEASDHWTKKKACKRSCYFAGHAYDEDICCEN
mmetsp:Transcript_23606/g.52281  ORF Transcript_23606/g.52281 Transcript_23606/m.52281 type:complete len:511 (-) Transcript_23606:239-1771(-)